MNVTKYIGLPYKVNGEYPAGADCWTLVKAFSKNELGVELPEFLYDAENLIKNASEHIKYETSLGKRWCKINEPEIGDVLILRIRGLASHCAIYVGNGDFLHTLEGRQATCESLHGIWKQSLVGIYRWCPDD